MQDNKQENQSLDDDILRCKADIREAMNTDGRPIPDEPVVEQSSREDIPVHAEPPIEDDDIFPDTELAETDSTLDSILLPDFDQDNPPPEPASVRILPFDTIQQNDHIDRTKEHASEKARLESTIRTLTDQLQEKTHALNEQTTRLIFIEKQLQMAAALEQAKSRLQQDNHNLNNKNQFLAEEKQQLEEDNRKLSANISQLRSRMQDVQVTDSQGQKLRKELESAELTLSQERAMIRNLESTIKTLEDNLAVVTQDKQHMSEKLEAKEQGLEQLKLKYDQLQNMYERFHEQEDSELSTLKGHLKDARDNSQKLQADFEQSRHEYEAFQTQANGEIHTLSENIDLLKNENRELREESSRLKEELQHIREISEKLHNAEFDLKNARQELLDERRCTGNLRQECEQLTSAISDIRREKEKLLNQLQERQSAEIQLRNEISGLSDSAKSSKSIQKELISARGEIDRLNDRIQSLEQQLNDMRQAVSVVPQENIAGPDEAFAEAIDHRTENQSSIPVFNLAEQIMEEHRRSVANRRHRREPASSIPQGNSIRNVVGQYISSGVPAASTGNERVTNSSHPWINQSLTPFQQEILQEIVRDDVSVYAHKRRTAGGFSSMNN